MSKKISVYYNLPGIFLLDIQEATPKYLNV